MFLDMASSAAVNSGKFRFCDWSQIMATCEAGYLCEICGRDVENITDSDLYLRYVLGDVSVEDLDLKPERHIRCNPTTAQFIVDPEFEPVCCEGAFGKQELDPQYVAEEERRVTRGWRRLQELPQLGLPITEYPLLEVIEARRITAAQQIKMNETEYAQRMIGYLEGVAEVRTAKDEKTAGEEGQ
jgi:hypothetical protein